MENSGEPGRFCAKNGNIIRGKMMAVLYVLAAITIEPASKKKNKGQMNVPVWSDKEREELSTYAYS